MEWLLLAAFVAGAGAIIGLPWRRADDPAPTLLELDALKQERVRLLEELRELDRDAAAGRLSEADRAARRRAIAPQLRAVTEELAAHGARFDRPSGGARAGRPRPAEDA